MCSSPASDGKNDQCNAYSKGERNLQICSFHCHTTAAEHHHGECTNSLNATSLPHDFDEIKKEHHLNSTAVQKHQNP